MWYFARMLLCVCAHLTTSVLPAIPPYDLKSSLGSSCSPSYLMYRWLCLNWILSWLNWSYIPQNPLPCTVLVRVDRKRSLEDKSEAAAAALWRLSLLNVVTDSHRGAGNSLLILSLLYSVSCSLSHPLAPLTKPSLRAPTRGSTLDPQTQQSHRSKFPSSQAFLYSPLLVAKHAFSQIDYHNFLDFLTFPSIFISLASPTTV